MKMWRRSNKENVVPPITTTLDLNYRQNDYVIVKFLGRKNQIQHYIGIIQAEEHPNDYVIKFFRRMGDSNKFITPLLEDVSLVEKKDIVNLLPTPMINNRDQYIFEGVNLSTYENLA